jgi:hypothetical protein
MPYVERARAERNGADSGGSTACPYGQDPRRGLYCSNAPRSMPAPFGRWMPS